MDEPLFFRFTNALNGDFDLGSSFKSSLGTSSSSFAETGCIDSIGLYQPSALITIILLTTSSGLITRTLMYGNIISILRVAQAFAFN